MFRRSFHTFALLPLIGALVACAQFGQTTPAPTPVASGPTVIVVTATPAPVQPTVAPPPTAVPPTAVPPATVPQEPHGIEQRIEFAPGNVSANTEGAVVRGTRDRYILGAQAGQRMDLALSSLENNAVFTVYEPNGQPLPGTEEGTDISNWSGVLPTTGDYVVSVGGTRGNATYRIKFTIVNPQPHASVGAMAGRLNYPSEYIPAQLVYAVRVDDPTFFYVVQTNEGDSGYSMRGMKPGDYYVRSYLLRDPDATLRSAFTTYVRCGLLPECTDHRLAQVTITGESTTGGVDVVDWYGSNGEIPNRPAGEPQPRSTEGA